MYQGTCEYKKGYHLVTDHQYMKILKDKIDRGTATEEQRDYVARDGKPIVIGKEIRKRTRFDRIVTAPCHYCKRKMFKHTEYEVNDLGEAVEINCHRKCYQRHNGIENEEMIEL